MDNGNVVRQLRAAGGQTRVAVFVDGSRYEQQREQLFARRDLVWAASLSLHTTRAHPAGLAARSHDARAFLWLGPHWRQPCFWSGRISRAAVWLLVTTLSAVCTCPTRRVAVRRSPASQSQPPGNRKRSSAARARARKGTQAAAAAGEQESKQASKQAGGQRARSRQSCHNVTRPSETLSRMSASPSSSSPASHTPHASRMIRPAAPAAREHGGDCCDLMCFVNSSRLVPSARDGAERPTASTRPRSGPTAASCMHHYPKPINVLHGIWAPPSTSTPSQSPVAIACELLSRALCFALATGPVPRASSLLLHLSSPPACCSCVFRLWIASISKVIPTPLPPLSSSSIDCRSHSPSDCPSSLLHLRLPLLLPLLPPRPRSMNPAASATACWTKQSQALLPTRARCAA